MSAATEREYTAHTVDETVWVRVATSGAVLGVQLEPEVMKRSGTEIAARIKACADVAYFEGQVALRKQWEASGVPASAFGWMPTVADLQDARARLGRL